MPNDERITGTVNPTLAAQFGQGYFDVAERLRVYMNNSNHTTLMTEDTYPYGEHLSKHHWEMVIGNETVRISRMEPRVNAHWYVMSTNKWCIEFGRENTFQIVSVFFDGERAQFEETILYAKLLIGDVP